jgi:hypothetical protein
VPFSCSIYTKIRCYYLFTLLTGSGRRKPTADGHIDGDCMLRRSRSHPSVRRDGSLTSDTSDTYRPRQRPHFRSTRTPVWFSGAFRPFPAIAAGPAGFYLDASEPASGTAAHPDAGFPHFRSRSATRRQTGEPLHPGLGAVRTERKAARVLGVMLGVFVFCWAPFFSLNLTLGVCGDQCTSRLSDRVYGTVLWLGYASSTLNPIVYTVFNRTFRRTFVDLLTCSRRPRRLRYRRRDMRCNTMA